MSDCKHCRNGWFSDQKFGQDVECVNGVLIDIDVAHDGWQRDVAYPLAPCHPEARKRLSRQKNDSQARLAAWATRDDPPDPRAATIQRLTAELVEARGTIDGATRVVRRAINKLLTDARARSMTREESGALDALRQLEIDVAAHARAALEPKP